MHRLLPACAVFVISGLVGCSEFARERIVVNLDMLSCWVGDNLEGAQPCPPDAPPPPAPPPLYCYRTLAGVECYADRVAFGPEPTWLRAAPPDIVDE